MSMEEGANVNISAKAFTPYVHYFKQIKQTNKQNDRFGLNNPHINFPVMFNQRSLRSCMLDFQRFVGMQ